MTVAVTGASGHLAANLIRRLLDDGRDVRAVTYEPLDVQLPGLRFLDVERMQADMRDMASVRAAIEGAEVVYHLAARISVTDRDASSVWATNVHGTRHVAMASLDAGVRRLVHVSSFAAIAPADRRAVIETQPSSVDPTLPVYFRSKAASERAIRAAVDRGLHAVIVNPTGMVGPHDFGPSLFGQTLVDLWRGKMPALVDGGCNLVDIRDVAQTMIAAETKGEPGERYLVGGTWMSLIEIAELSSRLFGTRVPRFTTPMWLARRAASIATAVTKATGRDFRLTSQALDALVQHRLVLDTKAYDELGHRPRPIEETLRDTYEWFVGQRVLDDARLTSADSSSASASVKSHRSVAISGHDTTPKFSEST